MKLQLAFLLLSFSLTAPALGADGQSQVASVKALALAHLLRPSPQPGVSPELEQTGRTIASNWLHTTNPALGLGCDPNVQACKDAANRVAQIAARQLIDARYDASVSTTAVLLDARMTPEQQEAAIVFFRGSTGAALAKALLDIGDPRSWPTEVLPKMAQISSVGSAVASRAEYGLYEQFFNETKSLPRRAQVQMPPPPSAPKGIQK